MKHRTLEQIDALVTNLMNAENIPGVTLAVIEQQRPTFTRACGVANLATQQLLGTDALFHLASVTKLFVGTSLLQLEERGQLDLDAPVMRYLPYLKLNDTRADEMTIRQMMMHTSGMPDTDYYGWENPEYDDGALERYVRTLGDLSLIAAPGEKYYYSNIAYEVLGDVIAKTSGLTFEEYVTRNILRPLRMVNSTLLVNQADPKLLATPHTRYTTGGVMTGPETVAVSPVFPYNRAHAPSSTLYSNVWDMSRFAMACLNRGELDGARILQRQTIDRMWTPAFATGNAFWTQVGLTWNISERQGFRIVGHHGEDVGFSTSFLRCPNAALQ